MIKEIQQFTPNWRNQISSSVFIYFEVFFIRFNGKIFRNIVLHQEQMLEGKLFEMWQRKTYVSQFPWWILNNNNNKNLIPIYIVANSKPENGKVLKRRYFF